MTVEDAPVDLEPTEPDTEAEAADEKPVDLDEVVWIIHDDVAVPNQVTRRVARDVWAESGWREANKGETRRFDKQLGDGLRPVVQGDGVPLVEQTAAYVPDGMVLSLHPPVVADAGPVVSEPLPTKKRPSRRAPKSDAE